MIVVDRPILFSAPMVRAILAGQKTQTRRVVKPRPPVECTHLGPVIGTYSGAAVPRFYWKTAEDYEAAEAAGVEYVYWPAAKDEESDGFTGDVYGAGGLLCPYGSEANCMKAGDRLWVREAHWFFQDEHDPVTGYAPPVMTTEDVEYRADGESTRHGWRPSIHMPRWASRITLEITGVRVERLQSISEADAMAEGIHRNVDGLWSGGVWPHLKSPNRFGDPRAAFCDLWASINGGESWDANPWVWVVEFKRA